MISVEGDEASVCGRHRWRHGELDAGAASVRGCGRGWRDKQAADTESDAASWLPTLRACVAEVDGGAISGMRGE